MSRSRRPAGRAQTLLLDSIIVVWTLWWLGAGVLVGPAGGHAPVLQDGLTHQRRPRP